MSFFSSLHPLIPFLYFMLSLSLSMAVGELLPLGLCMLCALGLSFCTIGRRSCLRYLGAILPMMLFATALQLLLSNEGSTALFTLPWGKVCTLEALVQGSLLALRLASVLLLFSTFQVLLPTDKLLYLLSPLLPSLSLTLAMGLGLIPGLRRHLSEVYRVQRCLHPEKKALSLAGLSLSVTLSWALEKAIDTADSMKSRGYGLPKGSHFRLYSFGFRDRFALLFLLSPAAAGILLLCLGHSRGIVFPLLTLLLRGFPLLYEGKELLRWHVLKSKT